MTLPSYDPAITQAGLDTISSGMVQKSSVLFSAQSVPRDSLFVKALVAQSLFAVHLYSACAAVVLFMNKIACEH